MTVLDTVKKSVIGIFNALPIVLMTSLIILAFGLVNSGMGWIFVGQVLLFPIVGAIHLITSMFGTTVPYSETLVLSPSEVFKSINIKPSMWLVQVSYFFSYLFMNAYTIYNEDPIDNGSDYSTKVSNRKARTMMIMTVSVLFLIILIGCRVMAKSEGNLNRFIMSMSILMSLAVGITGAYIWNVIGGQPNVGTGHLDIFGISQQMMSVPKTDEVTLCQTASL